jgi:hypothetical protein
MGLSCANSDEDLGGLQADLQRLTVPPRAEVLSSSAVERRGWSVEASWEFETTLAWPDYQVWLRGRMVGYTTTSDGKRLTLVRELPGDVVRLTVDEMQSVSPVRIRVAFAASAF